jgi:5-methylcytosine-specific restriction endonuclease McrA
MDRKSNWSEEQKIFIFNKTKGRCRHCNKPLVFKNRMRDQRGAWEIDHGRSINNDGSNHLKNMWALCVPCNMDKSSDNGARYDSQFERATIKGKLIDGLNNHLLGDIDGNGFELDNRDRRIKRR